MKRAFPWVQRLMGQTEPPPTFFLHLGMHKTGTTAIQNFCFQNSGLLRSAGIAYAPFAKANHSHFYETLFAQGVDHDAGHSTQRSDASREQGLAAFSDFLRSARRDCLSVLTSGESACGLESTSLQQLKELVLRAYERMVIVGFARPPLAFARSMSQQALRTGATLQEFFDAPLLPAYEKRFGRAIEVFGRENVRIGAFHKTALANSDALQGLWDLMGIQHPMLKNARAKRSNASTSLTAAKLLSAINHSIKWGEPAVRLPCAVHDRLTHPVVRELHGDFTVSPTRFTSQSSLLLQTILRIPGPDYRLAGPIGLRVQQSAGRDLLWFRSHYGIDLAALDEAPQTSLTMRDMAVFDEQEVQAIADAFDGLIASPEEKLAAVKRRFNRQTNDVGGFSMAEANAVGRGHAAH